jgi:hypothetical protein
LAAFLACRRRFQLLFRQRLPWPLPPDSGPAGEASLLGERFHKLLQRHFLGLDVAGEVAGDERLAGWWQVFREQGPPLPAGRRLTELTLTVPAGPHLLTGRFDLVVLSAGRGHVFDWKTEARPRPESEMVEDLQTKLYLALLVEGSAVLPGVDAALEPEMVSLTYWYVNAPDRPLIIGYSRAEHEWNWAWIRQVVDEIGGQLDETGDWPMVEDLAECSRCVYQVYCNRVAPLALAEERPAYNWEWDDEAVRLEPDLP